MDKVQKPNNHVLQYYCVHILHPFRKEYLEMALEFSKNDTS
jgi:hypothetical protein